MALGVTYPATPPPRTRTHRRARGSAPHSPLAPPPACGTAEGPGPPCKHKDSALDARAAVARQPRADWAWGGWERLVSWRLALAAAQRVSDTAALPSARTQAQPHVTAYAPCKEPHCHRAPPSRGRAGHRLPGHDATQGSRDAHVQSCADTGGIPSSRVTAPRGRSARSDLVDVPQTSQQSMIRVSWCCDHLEHRLKGPAVQLLFYLVSVKVRGHQAEEVNVHLLQLAHPADDVGKAGR